MSGLKPFDVDSAEQGFKQQIRRAAQHHYRQGQQDHDDLNGVNP